MTKERAMRLAAKWANGGVCTLSEGEAEEYHALCLEALRGSVEPNWVSVRDEMPKRRGRYLCYYHYAPESPDVICDNIYLGSGLWLSETNRVTHWRELPSLPDDFAFPYIGDETE